MPLKWLGFIVVVGSGLALFMSDATRLYRNWAFLVKAALLLLIALNARIFRARVYPDVAKSVEMPAAAKLSASLSLLLWFAIIVTSRLIGFVGPEY
jgi:cytochrome bd-type quinol oxidase subunit 2